MPPRRRHPVFFDVLLLALVLAIACVPGPRQPSDLEALAEQALSQLDGEIELPGLQAEVEVLRDRWGVPHIYADNVEDLFFAQGFVAAQDRMWQLDMWRRWLQGRTAELAGTDRLESDRIMRLLAWRGGLTEEEATSYHPEAERILRAFTDGINAFIEHRGDDLPVEFRLTGLRPEPWTPEVPTLRTSLTGVGGSLGADLRMARRVAELGPEEANRRADLHPFYELVVPEGLDPGVVTEAAVEAFSVGSSRSIDVELLPEYRAALEAQTDRPEDNVAATLPLPVTPPSWRSPGAGLPAAASSTTRAGQTAAGWTAPASPVGMNRPVDLDSVAGETQYLVWEPPLPAEHRDRVGSNNWVIRGGLSASGSPMLANDPHRQVTNPSLRYLAHLSAPDRQVIGSGEPALPGIAIGHNERIAWGLTIVGTDQIDVFVEELNPDDPTQVRYRGSWEPLRVEHETIAVRGADDREVTLEFSRHGPVVYKDVERGVAFAVRSFAQEPGTAPYLGSLRVDQAADCREFLEAMRYWKSPSENMICGDVDGNIAWRASALTPSRSGPTPWYGRLPVPGTGEYEWDGFRDDLPQELNPERGWIATANHDIQPEGFHPPIMFKSGPPYRRYERLVELLEAGGSGEGSRFTVEDFQRMQHDAFSAPAAEAVELFSGWSSDDEEIEWARKQIAGWDAVFDRDSTAAVVYMTWRREVDDAALDESAPGQERLPAVEEGLRAALDRLEEELGDERSQWRWGRVNRATFEHWMVPAYDLPSVAKSGGAGTVYSNGATFREVLDLADWDRGRATTAPGQSGQPGSPHYGDLIESWADGEYFPLAFSREAVEEATEHRLVLRPAGR